ncbi:MAG: RraA family protein [Alicyclobacillus herbarius]|nr:RraA family protein [Alicyclobacillus herbarius]
MTPGERQELLDLFEGLRVTDVRDGMDWNMMHHYGSVSYDIRPLYRTRAIGIARTARYVPYESNVPAMTPEEYTEWVSWYYREVCNDPWFHDIEPGDFIVIDQSGVDVGIIGSNNSLACYAKGVRGIVTNGGVRDTDEIILQRIPVWSKFISQKMDQGRIRFEAKNVPVNIGGVVVYPGDVVVADGDGVIVVPQKIAKEVAKYARQELEKDKIGRRKLYEKLGWELDETVK